LVSEMLRELLAIPNAPLFDIADRKAVASLLEEPESGPNWYGQLMAKPQTVAYFLQVNYCLSNMTTHPEARPIKPNIEVWKKE
jgi:asparagine synthase (glutamine-hydrolysing)